MPQDTPTSRISDVALPDGRRQVRLTWQGPGVGPREVAVRADDAAATTAPEVLRWYLG